MSELVSIVVPVFNRQSVLEQTIASVLSQTINEWELILVDDGSTDNSFEIANKFAEKDNRIKVYKRLSSQKGASVCRNEGVKHAAGKYILFLDSDDLLAPYCLAQRLNVMKSDSSLDFAVFPMVLFMSRFNDMNIIQNIETADDHLDRFLNRDMEWVISCPMWKRESLQKLGGLREDLLGFQDMELHVKALAMGFKFRILLNNAIADNFYRQDKKNTISSERDTPQHYMSQTALVRHLIELLKSTNTFSEKRGRLLANFLLLIALRWRFHKHTPNSQAIEQALKTWNVALEHKLITTNEHVAGESYIRSKFSWMHGRIGFIARWQESAALKCMPADLIWQRGTTQQVLKYDRGYEYDGIPMRDFSESNKETVQS